MCLYSDVSIEVIEQDTTVPPWVFFQPQQAAVCISTIAYYTDVTTCLGICMQFAYLGVVIYRKRRYDVVFHFYTCDIKPWFKVILFPFYYIFSTACLCMHINCNYNFDHVILVNWKYFGGARPSSSCERSTAIHYWLIAVSICATVTVQYAGELNVNYVN